MTITAGGQVTVGGDMTEGDKITTAPAGIELTPEEKKLYDELAAARSDPATRPEKIGEIMGRIAVAGFPALTQMVVALLKK